MAFRLLPEGEKCSVKRAAAQLTLALGAVLVTVSASVVSHELSLRRTESPAAPPAPPSEMMLPPAFAALPSPEAPPAVVLPPFPDPPASELPPTPSLPPDAATPEPALPPAGPPAPPLLSSTALPQATTTSNTRDASEASERHFITRHSSNGHAACSGPI